MAVPGVAATKARTRSGTAGWPHAAVATTSAGQKLDVELDRYHVPHDIKIYPGAKHSFFNDTIRNYNESAAQDSWGRVLAFFEEHLGAKAEV